MSVLMEFRIKTLILHTTDMRRPLTILLLSILCLIAGTPSRAQMIQFCDTTNSWMVTGSMDSVCAWERTATYGPDTLISGQHYRPIIYSPTLYSLYSSGCNAYMGRGFFVREDITHKIVYYRFPAFDQYEHVLYNYNMQPGDTIQYPYSMWGGGSVADSLASIDSALIGGVYHKVFNFQTATGRGNRAYTVIEGVGCVKNPLYPAYAGGCYGYKEMLRCFSQDGLVQDFLIRQNECYSLGGNYYTNCDYVSGTTRVAATTTDNVTVFPNPAGTYMEIKLPADGQLRHIAVHDVLGRTVYATQAGGSLTISTAQWEAGIYVVSIANGNGTASRAAVAIRH